MLSQQIFGRHINVTWCFVFIAGYYNSVLCTIMILHYTTYNDKWNIDLERYSNFSASQAWTVDVLMLQVVMYNVRRWIHDSEETWEKKLRLLSYVVW